MGPNEEEEAEEEDTTLKGIRVRMKAAMHDASEGTTEEPEGLSDGDGDAEALDGDFALGEDRELEGVLADDKEMKDPEPHDDEWADLPGSNTSLVGRSWLPPR